MKRKLKQLASTLGAFGGMASIICLTGATANGHLSIMQFAVSTLALSIVTLGCVGYIEKHTEGGEWVE